MKNIAVIISQCEEDCQSLIWQGICEAAKRYDVNLVTFPALSQDISVSHYPFISDFVDIGYFSGAILFTGAMSEYTAWPVVQRYASSLNLPVVSVAGIIENAVSSIVINNQMGILEQLAHLVKVHKKEHIAFVKGPSSNEEANERFQAYCDGLSAQNLPFRDELVFEGDFSPEGGREAVERLLSRGIHVDAIMCADDSTAIGVIDQLKRRDIYVPESISVIGFDDVEAATMITPALSTVHQPFYALGVAALEAVILEKPPKLVVKNTVAIYRTSCGCIPREVQMFKKQAEEINEIRSTLVRENLMTQLTPLVDHVVSYFKKATEERRREFRSYLVDSLQQVLTLFYTALEGQTLDSVFLKRVSSIIQRHSDFENTFYFWKYLFGIVFPAIVPDNDPDLFRRVNLLIKEVDILINTQETTALKNSLQNRKDSEEALRESCHRIISVHSSQDLYKTIMTELQLLGFTEAVLVLFSNYSGIPYLQWSMPMESSIRGSLADGRVVPVADTGVMAETAEILPSLYHPHIKAKSLAFLPLYVHGEYQGFLVVNVDDSFMKEIYEELRVHISMAIKNCSMVDRINAYSMTDTMTGLSNKFGFAHLVTDLLAHARGCMLSVLVVAIDIKALKEINNSFGYEEGNRAIRSTASLLKRTFRTQDLLVRLDSDHFAAVIELDVDAVAEDIVSRLSSTVQRYNEHSGKRYKLDLQMRSSVYKVDDSLLVDDIMRASMYTMDSHVKIL